MGKNSAVYSMGILYFFWINFSIVVGKGEKRVEGFYHARENLAWE